MAAQQAEFVAFKQEVATSIQRLEVVAAKANSDAAAASTLITELQNSYATISV